MGLRFSCNDIQQVDLSAFNQLRGQDFQDSIVSGPSTGESEVRPIPPTRNASLNFLYLPQPQRIEQAQIVTKMGEFANQNPTSQSEDDFDRKISTPTGQEQVMEAINSDTVSGQLINLAIDLNRDLDPPISEAEFIGSGSYGTVYKTTFEGRVVAVKVFHDRHQQPKVQSDAFTEELNIICRLKNDYIVECLGASKKPGEKAIVMEYVDDNLRNFIHARQRPIQTKQILVITKDITKALYYLHTKFAHGDLHAGNILITEDRIPKVSDFNLSLLVKNTAVNVQQRGAPAYAAPELFTQHKLSRQSDIFSLGVLIWEMYTQKYPWKGYGQGALVDIVSKGGRLPIPRTMPRQLKKLLKMCWQQDQSKRPSAQQVYRYCKHVLARMERREQMFQTLSKHVYQLSKIVLLKRQS